MIRVSWFALSAVLFFYAVPAHAQEKPLLLDELVKEALENNPKLRAARHQTASARTRVDQVAWPAPQIGVEFFQTPIQSFPNPLKNQMEMDYSIRQMIPFPGKLGYMEEMAASNAGMAAARSVALEKQVIRELKAAFFELYFVQRKIEINAENQDLMRRFVDIARKQYEVGMGKQPDILRAQTELSTLINEGINLQQERLAVEAMVNTILSRPANAPLGFVPDIHRDIPVWSFERIRPAVLNVRPELQAMRENIAMSQSALSLSKRDYFPNLMTGVMYKDMASTGNDFWSLMVGVEIPLAPWSGGAYTSKTEETEILTMKAEADFKEMENMVMFQVQDALVKVGTQRNLVHLYRNTVIPQAEQTLQSTVAAYQTGKMEFLMVIDAYRMVLMAKLDFHMSVMNFMMSQAALEQAVGMDLSELESRIR